MDNLNNIPKHWQIKRLGEVCQTTSGGTPSRGNKNYYNGNIPWVKSGELDKGLITDTEEKITQVAIDNSSAKIFPKGTLLIALYGATIGKLAFLGIDAATNQAVCGIFKNENIDSKYLYYFLFFSKPSLIKQSIGGAQPNISQGILKDLTIPLPPFPEQQAIVSKIEELFSELEKGKLQLETAQQQLKVYRQSVLKTAFEGRLTNKNGKWQYDRLGNMFDFLGGGTPSKEKKNFWNGNIFWASVKDIKGDYLYKTQDSITEEGIRNSATNIAEINDVILITRISPGKSIISKIKTAINQDLKIARPKFQTSSKFIHYFFSSIERDIINKSSGTTVLGITLNNLNEITMPVLSIKDQQLIVAEIENRFTVCDKLEETIAQGLQEAETLRQSILKQAFEGRLVKAVVEKREAKGIPLYKPKNEYFYQLQVLGLIAKASKQNQVQHGEMTMAKYAYFTDKVFGVPTFYDYKRWHLGPYPPAMKKAINNKQYFKKLSGEIEVLNEKTLLKSSNPYEQKIQSAVKELADIFSKYTGKDRSNKTELLATVCKVVEDIQTTDLKPVRKSMDEWKIELKGEKYKTKAQKFSEEETKKCLQFLREKGWDKKLLM